METGSPVLALPLVVQAGGPFPLGLQVADACPGPRQLLAVLLRLHGELFADLFEQFLDNETGFLTPLQEVADIGITPAERKLRWYHGKWGESVDPLFRECAY